MAGLLAVLPSFGQTTRPSTEPTGGFVPTVVGQDRTLDVLRDKQIAVVVADGMVDNFFRDGVRRRIEKAQAAGADAIILQINTYGGLVTAGLETSRFLKQLDMPIVAFVDDKAISAGSMIAMACDAIVMEPASQLGDSGVIAMGQSLEGTERAKAESPVLADFDDSARRKGYDPLLASSFVRVSDVVYAVQNVETGEVAFVDPEQYEDLAAGWVDVENIPTPLDGDGSLLTVGDETARAVGLSLGTFRDPKELAASVGSTVAMTFTPSAGERIVGILSSMTVRGILMTVMFLSMYAAFQAPGTGPPETIAAISLTVLFGVPFLTGFAEWYEILLVLVGIVLIAVEIFLLPGFGIFGISGLCSVLLGLALTFVGPIFSPGGETAPSLPVGFGVDWQGMLRGMLTAVLSLGVSLMLWLWLGRYLPKLPYANRLILKERPPTPAEEARAAPWPLVGATGAAVTDLRPGGSARFAVTDAPDDTSVADVVSDRGFVPVGTMLDVIEVTGNRVVVRPRSS
jgi:membrane-bound serine protease (ClpP class)